MTEREAWRSYLDDIIRRKTARQKANLYQEIGVTRTTVQRWRNGENLPDVAHVYRLLTVLPEEERDQLRQLLQQDSRLQMPNEALFVKDQPDRIPQQIYEEVLHLSRNASERFWLIAGTVLFHSLKQLHCAQTGMEMVIARCMPPRQDGKIRSLRAYAGRGTAPWRTDFHAKEYFLGAESVAGYAVMNRHSIMIPDLRDSHLIFPLYHQEHECSCAAFPIMRTGAIAGALVVSCCVDNFFDEATLALLERYSDLIHLAFFDQDFYPSSSIELGLMPDLPTQKIHFNTFRSRVNEEYKQAVARQSEPNLTSIEARIRQAIEIELCP